MNVQCQTELVFQAVAWGHLEQQRLYANLNLKAEAEGNRWYIRRWKLEPSG